MNQVCLIGRATRDPEVRALTTGETVAKYTLAVDRFGKKQDGKPNADFIPCVAFGKAGDFAGKYIHKGMKIGVTGRIQTGSYTNKDGVKVYTTDVIVNSHDFCEKAGAEDGSYSAPSGHASESGFMEVDDAELPWN